MDHQKLAEYVRHILEEQRVEVHSPEEFAGLRQTVEHESFMQAMKGHEELVKDMIAGGVVSLVQVNFQEMVDMGAVNSMMQASMTFFLYGISLGAQARQRMLEGEEM